MMNEYSFSMNDHSVVVKGWRWDLPISHAGATIPLRGTEV